MTDYFVAPHSANIDEYVIIKGDGLSAPMTKLKKTNGEPFTTYSFQKAQSIVEALNDGLVIDNARAVAESMLK